MSNMTNIPSCIKIPPTNTIQSTINATFAQKIDIKEILTFNNNLISLANKVFGEGKWNHTVTNQTIDFVEAFMGKYVCGCVTFVKIQLQDGTFHEDIGYCYAEGNTKGLSIHFARIGSLTDAYKKVLSCFGKTIETEIQELIKMPSNSKTHNILKDNLQCSLLNMPKPCAQSTPLLSHKYNEEIDIPENILCPEIPYDKKKESNKKIEENGSCMLSKDFDDKKESLKSNGRSIQKVQNNVQNKEDQKKVLTEEEHSRLERKRKQMEKKEEFKRLMKMKEQQKINEPKKLNPKY
ncbi:uncharacterized protein LOC143349788 [Colletes latitarsis]|uniref:uncharacterized protein LOC143349788 n=1 Tax=Colletes latitarsis TaxID=2605962 RepID=UPI0040375557